MKQFTINVDSDGVVYDFVGTMLQEARMSGFVDFDNVPDRDDIDDWDLAPQLGISKRKFGELLEYAIGNGVFHKGDPIPGAVEGVRTLIEAGHRIRIVTSKSFRSATLTSFAQEDAVRWYAAQKLIHNVELVFTGSKYGKTMYPAHVVIDDKPDLKWTQHGAVNVLFDQPWNQDAPIDPSWLSQGHVLYRAECWDDVLELVEQMGGGLLRDKSPVVV